MKKALQRFRQKVPWQWRWVIYVTTGIALFYIVEDTRGWLALKKAKAAYLATGKSLDIDEILGPMPPDEENFGAADFIVELYESEGKADVFPELVYDPGSLHPNQSAQKAGMFFNYPSIEVYVDSDKLKTISQPELGEAALKALAPSRPAFDEVSTALQRPYARYPGKADWNTPLYHLALIQNFVAIGKDYTVANLYTDNEARSVKDWLAISRACQKFGEGKSFIGWAIGRSLEGQVYFALWEILQSSKLSADSLALKESHLSNSKNASQLLNSTLELEHAITYSELTKIVDNRSVAIELKNNMKGYRDFYILPESITPDTVNNFLVDSLIRLTPRGWWWQNLAKMTVSQTVFANGGRQSIPKIKTPYSFLIDTSFDPLTTATANAKKSDTRKQLAILAIQLERYKIDNGSYPESFKTPSSEYGYQLGKNGRPILYYDEKGASPKPIEESNFDKWETSFLWRYPDE